MISFWVNDSVLLLTQRYFGSWAVARFTAFQGLESWNEGATGAALPEVSYAQGGCLALAGCTVRGPL